MRDVAKRAKISHTYLSVVEKGYDLRSGSPVNPTPDTLKALSVAYNHPYEDLMLRAGYIEVKEKESEFSLPESNFKNMVRRIEIESGISIDNDPLILESIEAQLKMYVKLRKDSDKG